VTPEQRDCLQAIRELTVDGVAPTYAQLCGRLGLKPTSKSAIHRLISQLERQGYVRRDPHRAQSVRIIERAGAAISDARIAAMSDEALQSAYVRIGAALELRASRKVAA
jgi:SOS-response transcriptional repressor LexA